MCVCVGVEREREREVECLLLQQCDIVAMHMTKKLAAVHATHRHIFTRIDM